MIWVITEFLTFVWIERVTRWPFPKWNKTKQALRHKTGNKQFCLGECNNIICVGRKRKSTSSLEPQDSKLKKRQEIRQITTHTEKLRKQDIINVGGFLERSLQIARKENQRGLRVKTNVNSAKNRQVAIVWK